MFWKANTIAHNGCDKMSAGPAIDSGGGSIWRYLRILGVVLMALSTSMVFAQMDQGAITGVVQDSSGAVIPGAQVTLTNIGTGLVLKTKCNATGDYFFSPIKTGTYTVSASAPNFQTTVQDNVVVHVTDRLNIPFKLTPGKVSETVTVTSAAPLMQTQTTETATDIDSKFLNDAPLANRNWIFIAQEAPGVTPMVGRGGSNGDFSSNGQHEEQNNYMLDGVDNNTTNNDYINGSSYNLAPPPDAIAEFKIETSNYSAEIGRGHAAVINATTKSGTNAFHGDAWEYVRNSALDALNWNQNPTQKAAPFHMNQFGATLGGPIIKNHLFFFGDIQESRYSVGANASTMSVPTPRERAGDFSELLTPSLNNQTCPVVLYQPNSNTGQYKCSGGTISVAPTGNLQQYGNQQVGVFAPGQNVFAPGQLDPVAQNILKMYPLPNANGWTSANNTDPNATGKTFNNYVVNVPSTSDPIQWDGRLDWNISSRDQATFRYDYQHIINTFQAPLGPILDGTGNYAGHNQSYLSENAMFSETHTFSPSLINEFRFGFNWGNDSNLQYNYGTNESDALGMHNVPFANAPQNGGLPAVSIGGIQAFGTHANDPAHEGQNVYQIIDNVTKVIGNHSLKMGFEDMPIRFFSTAAPNTRGSYSFGGSYTGVSSVSFTGNGVADFIAQGYTPTGAQTGTDNMASGGISTFSLNNYEHGYLAGYMQDDWKATHRLTLNIGLRYEYFTPKKEMAGEWNNWVGETGYMTPNGAVGSSSLVFPMSQIGQKLSPNLLALLAADNVQIVYSPNERLVNFPKANWSPRLGAAYQIDNKTVARIGGGVFFGAFEPGGGSGLTQNPPYVMTANLPSLPGCSNGTYCASQYSFNNTLEGGFAGFLAAGGIGNYVTNPSVMEVDPVMHTPYTINYNLSVQRAITPTMTATVSYVGSLGRHLVTLKNSPDMPMAITISGQQQNGMTPAPHFSGAQWMTWEGGSSYNSLQAQVQKRYSNGLSFLGTYTWAHALDNTIDLLGGDYGAYKQSQLIPIQYEWGQSGYDIRHRAVINVDYDLPFGLGKQFVNRPGILDYIVGGWKTDMEWWAQTGQPFTIPISRTGGYGNANGGLSNSAIKIGNPYSTKLPVPDQSNPATASGIKSCPTQVRTRKVWYNPCAFADPIGVNATVASLAPYATGYFSYSSPAIGYEGALSDGKYSSLGVDAPYVTGYPAVKPFFGSSKNDVSGPGNWRLNASMFKDFKVWREQYLELRADAFNLLNHPTLGGVGNTGTNPNITTGSNMLLGPMSQQSNTIDARYFQLSGKYVF
jgi:Carboxypeptidase regulatory-like domain/TonB-dependent Receptor Plug Domain